MIPAALSNPKSLGRTAPAGTAAVDGLAEPGAGGEVNCNPALVNLGGSSSCNAVPNQGWRFAGWDAPACNGILDPSCPLPNITSSTSVPAQFAPVIATQVQPADSGSASCTPNPVPLGGTTTCTATAGSGYEFVGWSGACSGSDAVCQLTSIRAPASVTANFAALVVNPQQTASGLPLVNVQAGSGWHPTPGSDPTQPSLGWIPLTGSSNSPAVAPPAGVDLPYGVLGFVLTGGTPGSSADVTIQYPDPLPANTEYWKYNRATKQWYPLAPSGYTVSGSTITLHLTDGGTGDSDGAANGVIVDPGGPAVPKSAGGGQAKPIPTVDELGLGLLAGLLGLLVLGWRWARLD